MSTKFRELPFRPRRGAPSLFILLLAFAASIALMATAIIAQRAAPTAIGGILIFASVLLVLSVFVSFFGLFVVNPNEARAMIFFGTYKGTVRDAGFFWANPFYSRKAVSLKARNLEGATLKVNDQVGNPIEIAAVVVWRVEDTAQALLEVDDYLSYVSTQTEAAVRHLAGAYPYDSHEVDAKATISLREGREQVAQELERELAERLAPAGVRVIEARLSHLAYAPEIASAMLQRQQAQAVVAARQKIVEGAVGMVELALARLAEHQTVTLDEERKAAMVSNLLVVLCSDRAATPVVNAGTLYH